MVRDGIVYACGCVALSEVLWINWLYLSIPYSTVRDIDNKRQVLVKGGILNRGGMADLNRGSLGDERCLSGRSGRDRSSVRQS